MQITLKIILLLSMPFQSLAGTHFQKGKSLGTLMFRCNGQWFTADSTHARGYAANQTGLAYINGANRVNMVIGIEIKNIKTAGIYYVNRKQDKSEFSINHKTYSIKQPGNFLKIIVTQVKQQGPFMLLNGTFEGELEDRNGNKVKITEGSFETRSL